MTTDLTDYGTGLLLEPHLWPGVNGRVDFDDPEGTTFVTLWIERGADGTYYLRAPATNLDRLRVEAVDHSPLPKMG